MDTEKLLIELIAKVDALTIAFQAHLQEPAKAAPQEQLLSHRGLPAISDMSNLELTFFDNEKGSPGKARFTVKAEINVGTEKKDFSAGRDFVEYADLSDLSLFESKLKKRKISDGYREMLKKAITYSIAQRAEIMIGMFNVKGGGVKGTHWLEKQFIMIWHNGENRPIHGLLVIGEEDLQFKFTCGKHPVTGKPLQGFATAKAIVMPKKELAATEALTSHDIEDGDHAE